MLQYEARGRWMTPPSPSFSSSSIRCLLVAMVTSPSVPPYGEAGRLEDILETGEEKGGRILEFFGRERRKPAKDGRYDRWNFLQTKVCCLFKVCFCGAFHTLRRQRPRSETHNILFSGPVSRQPLGRPSNTLSGLPVCSRGLFKIHISKRRPLLQMEPACTGIVKEMTMS